jgi:hypothetical protein
MSSNKSMRMRLDWAAPILPGHSIAGIPFGMPLEQLLSALKANSTDGGGPPVLRFANSPLLRFEQEGESLRLRAIEIPKNYDWQDVVMRLGFKDGMLSFARVDRVHWDGYSYNGKLFDDIGLGGQVRSLCRHLEPCLYDDAEEWFYFGRSSDGVRVAGSACSLEQDPEQVIGTICVASRWLSWPQA